MATAEHYILVHCAGHRPVKPALPPGDINAHSRVRTAVLANPGAPSSTHLSPGAGTVLGLDRVCLPVGPWRDPSPLWKSPPQVRTSWPGHRQISVNTPGSTSAADCWYLALASG